MSEIPHPGTSAMDGAVAPAVDETTKANIGAKPEASPSTPAVKDRIDKPEVPGACLSLRTLEGTSTLQEPNTRERGHLPSNRRSSKGRVPSRVFLQHLFFMLFVFAIIKR